MRWQISTRSAPALIAILPGITSVTLLLSLVLSLLRADNSLRMPVTSRRSIDVGEDITVCNQFNYTYTLVLVVEVWKCVSEVHRAITCNVELRINTFRKEIILAVSQLSNWSRIMEGFQIPDSATFANFILQLLLAKNSFRYQCVGYWYLNAVSSWIRT